MDERESRLNRLVRGTALSAGGAFVGRVSGFVVIAVLLNRLGTEAFAVVALMQAVMQMPVLLESGVGQAVVRRMADGSASTRSAAVVAVSVRAYRWLGLLSLVVGALFVRLLLGPVLGTEPDAAARVAALYLVGGAALRLAFGFVPRMLVGSSRLGLHRATELTRSVLAMVLVLVFVPDGPDGITTAAAVLMLSDVIAVIVGAVLVGRALGQPMSSRGRTAEARGELWAEARPLLATNALGLAWTRADPFIVAVILGPVGVAAYSIALQVYDTLRAGLELLFLGLTPASTRYLGAGDRSGALRLTARAMAYGVCLIWPVAIVVCVFAGDLLPLWIDEVPDGASGAVVLVGVLVFIVTVPSAALYTIVAAKRVGDVVGWQVVAAPLNLLASIVAVYWWGAGGVFVGTMIGTLVIVRRYLDVLGGILAASRWQLLRGLVRPIVVVGLYGLALLGIRVLVPDAAELPLALALSVAYLAVLLTVLVPRRDLQRLMRPAASKRAELDRTSALDLE